MGRRDEGLAGRQTLNIFATLAHHPKLMKRWLVFGNHVLAKNTLPARDRELSSCARAGTAGRPTSGASTWPSPAASASPTTRSRGCRGVPTPTVGREADAVLLRAADELHDEQTLSDATYAALDTPTTSRICSTSCSQSAIPPGVDGAQRVSCRARRRRHGRSDSSARVSAAAPPLAAPSARDPFARVRDPM